MNYEVIPTPDFKKHFKRLAKKYPSLKSDLAQLVDKLEQEPDSGVYLGHNLYKVRMAISSKGKGKSAGARIITYMISEQNEVFLVHIYDKSQLDNISKKQILEIINSIGL
ncbi:MAG: type II toxin-antitoxin system RelE/ParE family toxin [Cryomorphaceae bacterium]|nr:type II toxin-antitoxin system RelE/ParE family toxin [Cryomorphaceae bacterium]